MTISTTINPHPYTPEYSLANPLIRPMGRNGVVASHHYLASEAGLEILRKGGNAIDAAVAVSAALGVVEPAMNGAGGNGNMLIYWAADDRTYCLDFSGTTPRAAGNATSGDVYFGPRAQLVPGNLDGWLAALERFGTMDRESVFAPAIRHADDGYPVSPTLTYYIGRMLKTLQGEDSDVARTFAPGGRAYQPGEIVRQPHLANTYRAIAKGGAEVFYRGEIARAIASHVSERGGWLSAEDLAAYQAEWQEPLVADYDGWRVSTPPPPCSGVQILETLRILEGFDLKEWNSLSADYLHVLVEAIKLARHDRVFEGSSTSNAHRVSDFLSDAHVQDLRRRIDMRHAAPSEGDWYTSPHTTHFSVADRNGNVVSSTQTLGAIFGSGVVVDGTGLILNGLLFLFDFDPGSPNQLAPGKKIDDPMAPLIARHRDGRTLAVGSPGGQGILQTNVQMFLNVAQFGLSPQQSVEAPRLTSWGKRAFIDKFGRTYDPTALALEDRFPEELKAELASRGHALQLLGEWSHAVGAGAIALRHANGVVEGGADPRRDGLAYAF
ncbi:MAG: gamma-glutamyltransferase [Chloroflexi bacterium]|nr:MAG: gamma-glutamyltransferase [Chloroflexota bacterium]